MYLFLSFLISITVVGFYNLFKFGFATQFDQYYWFVIYFSWVVLTYKWLKGMLK